MPLLPQPQAAGMSGALTLADAVRIAAVLFFGAGTCGGLIMLALRSVEFIAARRAGLPACWCTWGIWIPLTLIYVVPVWIAVR